MRQASEGESASLVFSRLTEAMNNQLRREFIRHMSAMGAVGTLVGVADAASAQSTNDHESSAAWPVSDAERAAAVAPVNMQFAPGDVRRYGADPSGAHDSTQSFIDANSVGTHGGGSLRIPSGRYKYAPTDTLDIAVSWLGDGPHETWILCDTSKFAGEFFRIVGSTELRDLLIQATGPTNGTGVRLAPADVRHFTGHTRLTRVWVFGFDHNIQCDNNYEVTFDQVRSQMGNEGFYCVPETGEGIGYATTHLHLNCYYAQNRRNVFYAPSIRYAFRTITFVGGAIELATGDSCQASFTRCSPLKFVQIYLEAAPKIPALVLNDCTASIDGAYLGGTGGIKVGANTRIDLRQALAMLASDVFNAEEGAKQVVMQDCSWPASGNVLAAASVTLRNTSINGTMYRDCTPESTSLGAIRFSRQTTLVDTNAAQDVYRFLNIAGGIIGGSISGRFEIIAKDKGDPTNQAVYECWVGSTSGGPKHASLVLLQRLARGTDVGASATPLSLAEDGDRAGVKLQFLKNSGIQRVLVDVFFHGLTN
jgi:hypothetical protein